MKTFYIKTFNIVTFGCRVNQAESRMMGEKIVRDIKILDIKILRDKYKKPDLVIINTCCVTGKAEREVRKEIRRVKRENPGCFLVVTGCWVNKTQNSKLKCQNQNLKLKIDLLVSNKDKEKIPQIIKRIIPNSSFKQFPQFQQFSHFKDKYAHDKKALIKIQEGCDNFCTYCIVPLVRGRSKSRDVEEIIKEIKQKVKEGIEEVVLCGIDISSFKFKRQMSKVKTKCQKSKLKNKNHLVGLIKLILKETKIKKISFGSMNLEVFDEEFMKLYSSLTISNFLTSHFHIPMQSGCTKTLHRMGRTYKIFNFQFLISKLIEKIPNFTFSTDLIVGFPGETEQEFSQTLKTINWLKKILGKDFTHCHIFRYSSRKGTAASKMEAKKGWEAVSEGVKKERGLILSRILSCY